MDHEAAPGHQWVWPCQMNISSWNKGFKINWQVQSVCRLKKLTAMMISRGAVLQRCKMAAQRRMGWGAAHWRRTVSLSSGASECACMTSPERHDDDHAWQAAATLRHFDAVSSRNIILTARRPLLKLLFSFFSTDKGGGAVSHLRLSKEWRAASGKEAQPAGQ